MTEVRTLRDLLSAYRIDPKRLLDTELAKRTPGGPAVGATISTHGVEITIMAPEPWEPR
jgi:hypothetical protein